MKKLRFSHDKGSMFYKELTQRVNDYFADNELPKYGNAKMKWKIALYFSLNIVSYGLMLNSHGPWLFISFYLFMGLSILLTAFNISHDAAHGVAVKSKFWNRILFSISFNLQGNNAYVWGKNHNESHHLYTNVEGSDIDVLENPLFRMTPKQRLRKFHKYQYLYAPVLYLLYSLNWFFFREFLMLFNKSSRTIQVSIPKLEVAKLIGFKLLYIGYMLMLPMYILPFAWWWVVLAFFLNHFVISWLFVGVLGVSHLSDYVSHPVANDNNKLNMSWPSLQLCTSVDYNADSTFLNWTLGGFNAHTLHHLLPNVCHIHYLEILPIFKELIAKYDLTYMEMPYTASLLSHFRFLKVMGHHKNPKPRHFER